MSFPAFWSVVPDSTFNTPSEGSVTSPRFVSRAPPPEIVACVADSVPLDSTVRSAPDARVSAPSVTAVAMEPAAPLRSVRPSYSVAAAPTGAARLFAPPLS